MSLETVKEALSDHYDIEYLLGKGGMSLVYKGTARTDGRDVAVKVFRPEFAITLLRDRFHQEVLILSTFRHPNILPLLDSGESEYLVYYVMPFAREGTLNQRIERERRLSLDDTIAVTRAIAAALDYAHQHEVIHRDVKPENVVFDEGRTMLCDFGIARAVVHAGGERISTSGLIVGTPEFMSPEQAAGRMDLDFRTDVYALACTVYDMLAGEPPFTGRSQQAIRAKHIREHPPSLRVVRPDLPQHVEDAVMRGLAKRPEDRCGSAGELAAGLEG